VYPIDRERWARFGIIDQMGNIGSEVGRSINAWKSGNEKRFYSAVERGVDLFEATVEVTLTQPKSVQRSRRLRKILAARDRYLRLFFDGPFDPEEAASVDRYFMRFAMVARAGHFRMRREC
jgi:hypothetical protein